MKTWMKTLVPGLVLFSLLGLSALGDTRVATVNLQKIFDKYWRTEQVTASLKDRVADLEKSHKEMLDGWKKAKEEYQALVEDANNQAVSSDERDRRKKAAEDKLRSIKGMEDDITQFERQAAATIGEQKARMRKNLLDDIKLAIEAKAKAGGYTLVVDTGAQTYAADPSGPYYTPNVLYSSDSNDLTEAIILQLNAGAPLDIPKAGDKSAVSPDTKPK